jgi:hypothetical protein
MIHSLQKIQKIGLRHRQIGSFAASAALYGARGGTRTPTPLLASGPKPGASTNFATRATKQNGEVWTDLPMKSVNFLF